MAKKLKNKRLKLYKYGLESPGRCKRPNPLFKDDFLAETDAPRPRSKKNPSQSKSPKKREAVRKRKADQPHFNSTPIVIPSEEVKSRTPVKQKSPQAPSAPKTKAQRSAKRNKQAPHYFLLEEFFQFFETELKVPSLSVIKNVDKETREAFVIALVKRTKVGYGNELLLSSTEIQTLLDSYSQVIKASTKMVEDVYNKYLKEGNLNHSLTANPLKQVNVAVHDSSDGRKRSLSFNSDLQDNNLGESRRGRFQEVLLRQRRSHFRGAKKWMSVAWDLLDSIKNHSKSYPFHKPVDPQALECQDYYEVIEHPMDLSLIEAKLKNEWYHSMQEVIDDYQQMFSNCLMYNGEEHKLAEPCKQVRKRFHNFLNHRKF